MKQKDLDLLTGQVVNKILYGKEFCTFFFEGGKEVTIIAGARETVIALDKPEVDYLQESGAFV